MPVRGDEVPIEKQPAVCTSQAQGSDPASSGWGDRRYNRVVYRRGRPFFLPVTILLHLRVERPALKNEVVYERENGKTGPI
jgi:hypothetical protein